MIVSTSDFRKICVLCTESTQIRSTNSEDDRKGGARRTLSIHPTPLHRLGGRPPTPRTDPGLASETRVDFLANILAVETWMNETKQASLFSLRPVLGWPLIGSGRRADRSDATRVPAKTSLSPTRKPEYPVNIFDPGRSDILAASKELMPQLAPGHIYPTWGRNHNCRRVMFPITQPLRSPIPKNNPRRSARVGNGGRPGKDHRHMFLA